MLFNSFDFAVFLPLAFAGYWLLPRRGVHWQNAWLVLCSYVFYAWWDWHYLGLIVLSTAVDFVIGRQLACTARAARRKLLLVASLVVNLGLLAYFKYANFFIDSWVDTMHLLGYPLQGPALDILLPVGISFYTFQTLSYTVDIYRRRLEPTRSFVTFAAFVSFFPQLVAGPIERAQRLVPQLQQPRRLQWHWVALGGRQILWGLLLKVGVADVLSAEVDHVFAQPEAYGTVRLGLGAVLFGFQIYCDFAGYSHIAIGTAKLFGIDLMQNFATPYFSQNIPEFWRRWHISLSTWFRDYVYVPLGGSRVSRARWVANVAAVFLVSGLWHGANWSFVVWGALHAAYYLLASVGPWRVRQQQSFSGRLPTAGYVVRWLPTLVMVMLAWVFFRADSVGHAVDYLAAMTHWQGYLGSKSHLALVGLLMVWEWHFRDRPHGFDIGHWPAVVRWLCYVLSLWWVLDHWSAGSQFIYFQF